MPCVRRGKCRSWSRHTVIVCRLRYAGCLRHSAVPRYHDRPGALCYGMLSPFPIPEISMRHTHTLIAGILLAGTASLAVARGPVPLAQSLHTHADLLSAGLGLAGL